MGVMLLLCRPPPGWESIQQPPANARSSIEPHRHGERFLCPYQPALEWLLLVFFPFCISISADSMLGEQTARLFSAHTLSSSPFTIGWFKKATARSLSARQSKDFFLRGLVRPRSSSLAVRIEQDTEEPVEAVPSPLGRSPRYFCP